MSPYRPSREDFEALAADYPLVPVWRRVVADLETPVSAFLKLSGDGPAFLLESVEGGERWGRYSFVGVDPFLVMSSRDGVVRWDPDPPGSMPRSGSPLEVVRGMLDGLRAPQLEGLPPFHGGAVGYLGYDVVRYLEALPQTTEDDVGVPELLLMLPRTLVCFDHLRQELTIVSNVVAGDDFDAALDRTEALVEKLGRPLEYRPIEVEEVKVEMPESTMTSGEFEAAVEKAKKYIMAGDIFQVVLSHRFSADLGAEPFDVYRALRLVNPSPYMFFIRHPEVTVIGSSPEPLVTVQGSKVTQRPIAGTRRRGSTEEEDLLLEQELLTDEKERAEHVMLVDLARNDVGRVCRFGTVEVEELMAVERYSHVMHLVSQVRGELAGDRTALDALYASFPAGTVSGAPKIRAMEIIDELEPTRRGPYAGVVGYFDLSGNLDTCIALRTAYCSGGRIHLQVGAGIVADSDPGAEWQETVDKGRALLVAVAMAERSQPRQ